MNPLQPSASSARGLECVPTMPWNECPPSRGMSAHLPWNTHKLSHNIKTYWDHLHNSAIGDEKLSQTIAALKPYIDSLSQIDSDGQEFRYHRNRDDDPSLAEHAVANYGLYGPACRSSKS